MPDFYHTQHLLNISQVGTEARSTQWVAIARFSMHFIPPWKLEALWTIFDNSLVWVWHVLNWNLDGVGLSGGHLYILQNFWPDDIRRFTVGRLYWEPSELKMGRDKVSIEYCRGLCPSANNLLLWIVWPTRFRGISIQGFLGRKLFQMNLWRPFTGKSVSSIFGKGPVVVGPHFKELPLNYFIAMAQESVADASWFINGGSQVYVYQPRPMASVFSRGGGGHS